MATALGLAGVLLQVIGVATTSVGVWKTWHEFAEGEGFWLPIVGALRSALRRVEGVLRRVLRRPQRIEGRGALEAHLSLSGQARARIDFGPLPTAAEAAFAELDRRTRLLADQLATAIEHHDQALEEARASVSGLSADVELTAQRLRTQVRHVAIGGLRWEALGLLLIALGLLAQGFSSAFGS